MSFRYLYVGLGIALMSWSQAAQAGLSHELAYKHHELTRWNSRARDITDIESNLMRNKRFDTRSLEWMQSFLHNGHLDDLNRFLNFSSVRHSAPEQFMENMRMVSHKTNVNNMILNLPTLNTDSYRGDVMSEAMWKNLNYGDGYFYRGFSQAPLHYMQRMPMQSSSPMAV